jgi:hypothetical protein
VKNEVEKYVIQDKGRGADDAEIRMKWKKKTNNVRKKQEG